MAKGHIPNMKDISAAGIVCLGISQEIILTSHMLEVAGLFVAELK
jgi:hypothetical protein